jgi:hypothetical protein
MNTQNQVKHKFEFNCLDCKKTFEIEGESSNVMDVFPQMCPFCGAKRELGWLEWKFVPPPTMPDSLEKKRKNNRSASMEAMAMAGRYAQEAPKEEMVEVRGPAGRFGRGVEQVPKKAVDGLTNKLMGQ